MAKILFVEDNRSLVESITKWLKMQNHLVDSAVTGTEALDLLAAFEYDLLILDWDLPEISGLDVLKRYRSKSGQAAILMLTGKDSVTEKETALDAGADDYLTKPFEPRELGARMRALLRRPKTIVEEKLTAKDIVLDSVAKKVLKAGKEISLQPLEMAVLEFFMRHPNQVYSPEHLIRLIWDSEQDVSTDALYTCIRRLRKKIDSEGESMISTVHGLGYRFDTA
jgi:DNA-binding response OmpR family regulator